MIGDFAILMKEQQHNIPLFRRLDGVSLAHKICALFFPCSSTIKHLDLADQQIVLDKILEICSNSQRGENTSIRADGSRNCKEEQKKSNFDSPKSLNSPLSKQLPNLSWPNSLLSTPTREQRGEYWMRKREQKASQALCPRWKIQLPTLEEVDGAENRKNLKIQTTITNLSQRSEKKKKRRRMKRKKNQFLSNFSFICKGAKISTYIPFIDWINCRGIDSKRNL